MAPAETMAETINIQEGSLGNAPSLLPPDHSTP